MRRKQQPFRAFRPAQAAEYTALTGLLRRITQLLQGMEDIVRSVFGIACWGMDRRQLGESAQDPIHIRRNFHHDPSFLYAGAHPAGILFIFC